MELTDISQNYSLDGRVYKDHLALTPGYGQGHLTLDQVAQGPIQAHHEHHQGWGITTSHVPVSHHLLNKEFILNI